MNILTGIKSARMDMGYSGTEADLQLVRALMSAESGRPADEYGSVSTLVYGPLVKGQEARG
jgi:phospholipid/cholesterol/gamma-HCH transport system substrate-binding protein